MNSKFGFFTLLLGNSKKNLNILIFYAIISGVANALLLAVVNNTAINSAHGTFDLRHFLMFIVSFGLFFVSKRFILRRTAVLVENAIADTRLSIIAKLRKSDLRQIEKLGSSEIYSRLTNETALISQASSRIVGALQSILMVVCVMIYIAFISIPALLIALFSIGAGIAYFLIKEKALMAEVFRTTELEKGFFKTLGDLLGGFKEVKLNKLKNDDLYESISGVIESNRGVKVNLAQEYNTLTMFSETFFYLLLAVIVFVLPIYSLVDGTNVVQITTAVLFIIGPLEHITESFLAFNSANVAMQNIFRLERAIQVEAGPETDWDVLPEPIDLSGFQMIEMRGVRFSYRDESTESTFSVGPIDLKLQQGEILVIEGGNGSGKSTLMKLLTGLYIPVEGQILIDGVPIRNENRHSFRELFGAIFTDFHLFEKLYGLSATDPELIIDLLRKLKIQEKVGVVDGRFSTTNLSTGQKKRLGLLVTILENKPVYVFDEIAADQDPGFRKYFYTSLVKEFQAQGKTIVMVSHDDRFFDVGSRIVRMDFGKLVSIST